MSTSESDEYLTDSELSSIRGDESPRQLQQKEASQEPRKPGSWSCLKHPELIVPEAFDGLSNRVPRQIAAVLGISLEAVMATFDEVLEDGLWRQRRNQTFNYEEIKAFAEKRRLTFYYYHGSRLVALENESSDQKRSLVCAHWDGLLYFLRDAGNLVKTDKVRQSVSVHSGSLVKSLRRPPQQQPPQEEFPWHLASDLSKVLAGRYWVLSMDTDSRWTPTSATTCSNA